MAIKMCPHCKSDRVFLREQILWRNCNDSTDTIGTGSEEQFQCFDCLNMLEHEEPVEHDPQVCGECGSRDVYSDAWVGINDPMDVRTFDETFCADCDGPTSTVTHTEYHTSKENN